MQEIEGLNNRETAIAIWIGLVAILSLFKKDARHSLGGLAKLFFGRKIFAIYLLSVGYTCIGIFILYRLHAWTIHELKDVALWCTVTIVRTMMKLTSEHNKKNRHFFKEALREVFMFTIFIEFITETYTFGLITELILVPLLVLIGGMQALAADDAKYKTAKSFLYNLVIIYGLTLFAHAIYEIVRHFHEFASAEKLREFIISPALVLWFLPWLFLLSVYMRFETAFIMLKFSLPEKHLRRIAKRKAFFAFLFDVEGLERWKMRLNFYNPENASGIAGSIAEIKALQKIEKNPPYVDPADGWSPYEAKDFLKADGIETRYYENAYEDEWSASSPYTKIDDDFMADGIAYYVSGNRHIAKELELRLNINQPAKEKESLQYFLEKVSRLYACAVNEPVPEALVTHLLKKKKYSFYSPPLKVTLHRDDYNSPAKQYSYTFTIVHN
jgi:hypothetical protein